MTEIVSGLILGLLGFATGIFFVLSMVEKPVWKLMRRPRAENVPDEMVRTIHAQLKRVIHLLPPAMGTTVLTATGLMIWQLIQSDYALMAWAVIAIFWGQKFFVILRLRKGIGDVVANPSDGDIGIVRDGLGALALLHHQGLLAVSTAFIAQAVFLYS